MKLVRILWNRFVVTYSLGKKNAIRSPYRSLLLTLGISLIIALETGITVSIDTLHDDFVYDTRNQNFTDKTGYIFVMAHNILADVPPKNIVHVFDTLNEIESQKD